MGNTCLGPDDVGQFVDPSQEDVAKVDGPDAVVDLLEADRVLLEGIGVEHEPLFEPNLFSRLLTGSGE